MRTSFRRFLAFVAALLAITVVHAQREKLPPEDLALVEAKWPTAKKNNMGIRYIIEREGHGPLPVPGDLVSVLYTGKLLSGADFDKSTDPTRPFVVRVGRDMVIQGWDYSLQQMKVGERRMVIIPSELAYGHRGQPPRIPRNATLVFVIDLLEIKKE